MRWLRGASSPEDEFASEVIGLGRGILGLRAKRVDGFALQIERPAGPPVTTPPPALAGRWCPSSR